MAKVARPELLMHAAFLDVFSMCNQYVRDILEDLPLCVAKSVDSVSESSAHLGSWLMSFEFSSFRA